MGKILFVIMMFLMFLGPALLLGGWVTMLCLGALSHIFAVPQLAIAYWPSVLVDFILFLLFGGFSD